MSVVALKLAVTDTDGSPLDLLDRTSFLTPRNPASKFGMGSTDGRTVELPILCYGPTPAVNWKKIAQKLYTYAPRGAGPWGMAQENVVLLMKLDGESNYTSIDVVGGMFDPTDLFQVGAKIAARATLLCLPWARGSSTTYSFVMPTGGGAVWLSAVPGDVPAIARVRLMDTSLAGKNIVRLRLGQHSHPDLAQADITPFLTPTAQSPGATFADTTAYGGTSARLNLCTSAMQAVARASGPTTGKFNRRARVFAKVKSSIAPVGQPGNFGVTASAGAGNIGTETITACVVPYDGTAPYVSGVNHLGTPSALLTKSTQLLVAGGTQQVALNPLFYDDFELNSLVRWFPGPGTLAGTSSVTVAAAAKDTGTYGARLTATTAAVTLHLQAYAPLAQQAPTLPAGRRLSAHCRMKITTETNQESNATYQGLRLFVTLNGTGTVWGLGSVDGTNWGLYSTGTTNGVGGITLAGGTTTTLGAGFHDVELTFDGETTTDGSLRLTIDGVPMGGSIALGTATPNKFTVQAVAVANGAAATEVIDVDTFSITDGYLGTGASISSYAYIYSWDAATNATGGYLLKYTTGTSGVWNSLDAGLVTTYTLTTILPNGITLNSPPPSGLPGLIPTAVGAKAGLQGSALTPVPANPSSVNCVLGGSRWEWLDLGEFDLGPLIPRWQTQPAPWYVEIDAANSSGGTLAVDQIAVIDARLDRQTLTQLSSGSQYTWDSDTRPDNEVGVALTGQSLTGSGNEITDVTRTTATEGDGATIPGGYGIWQATGQGVLNDPSFESGIGSWGASAFATLTWDTAQAKFGTHSLKNVVTSGGATQGCFYTPSDANVTAGQTITASVWVYSASAVALTLHVVTQGIGAIGDTNFTTTPGAWVRVTKTGVVGGAGAGKSIGIQVYTQAAVNATFWIDAVQTEQGSIATPFYATAGGGRPIARVQTTSSTLLSNTTGFVAFRVVMGFASASGLTQAILWSWYNNANNYYDLWYDGANTRWTFTAVQGGTTVTQTRTGFTYVGGESVTVVAYWTGSNINLAVNNGTVGTAAVAGSPSSLPTNFDIGSGPSIGAFPFNGTITWAAFGTGTPTAADLLMMQVNADVAPVRGLFSQAAAATGVWPARTAIMDAAGYAGVGSASAPLTLGPGGTWLTIIPEVGDGSGNALADAVNARAELDVIVTPRYSISQGT